MSDTPVSELLDELIEAHKVIGLDRKWHARQIAARQAIESAFNKLSREMEMLGEALEQKCLAYDKLFREWEADHDWRSSSLTPEEAAEILEGITKRSTRDKLRAISSSTEDPK